MKFKNKIKYKKIILDFDYYSAALRQAMKLIKKFDLMSPVELFKHRILIKKPEKQIEKQCQLAENSRKIIQQLDTEQRSSEEKSTITEIQKWKNCFKCCKW